MDINTNDFNVAKLQLAWEIIKNVEHFEKKAYKEKSEELAVTDISRSEQT